MTEKTRKKETIEDAAAKMKEGADLTGSLLSDYFFLSDFKDLFGIFGIILWLFLLPLILLYRSFCIGFKILKFIFNCILAII